jgi:hypothetical protein
MNDMPKLLGHSPEFNNFSCKLENITRNRLIIIFYHIPSDGVSAINNPFAVTTE